MNELAIRTSAPSIFTDENAFETAQRMVKPLAQSNIVPAQYKNNIADCLIALEMANRMGTSPLLVMQNMNVIHGKPSWGSSFIIATMNGCGRFEPLEYEFEDRGPIKVGNANVTDIACRVVTTSKRTGKQITGPWVSIGMAVSEGWYTKSGSKWPNMPELMLQYRAAAFFGRLHAPDILMGMQTQEEVYDISNIADSAPTQYTKADVVSDIDKLNDNIRKGKAQGNGKEVKADPTPDSVAHQEPARIDISVEVPAPDENKELI